MHIDRATLSAASPVFDAAFSSQMSEGNTATYEIKDSTPTAVEAMLRYIYIGDSDCLPDDLAFLLDLSSQRCWTCGSTVRMAHLAAKNA